MKVRNLMDIQGLRTGDLVKKSGLSGFTINQAVCHDGMSPSTRKILARVMGVHPLKLGKATLKDRGFGQPKHQYSSRRGFKYDMATKNAIIETARNSRLAGKSWKEVLEEAKKVGYAGSLQGVEKMTGRIIGKVRKGRIGRQKISPVGVAPVVADKPVRTALPQKEAESIEHAVVNALYSARGQEGFSKQEAQTAIEWAKNILQEQADLQRIMEGKAKINVENGTVQVVSD